MAEPAPGGSRFRADEIRQSQTRSSPLSALETSSSTTTQVRELQAPSPHHALVHSARHPQKKSASQEREQVAAPVDTPTNPGTFLVTEEQLEPPRKDFCTPTWKLQRLLDANGQPIAAPVDDSRCAFGGATHGDDGKLLLAGSQWMEPDGVHPTSLVVVALLTTGNYQVQAVVADPAQVATTVRTVNLSQADVRRRVGGPHAFPSRDAFDDMALLALSAVPSAGGRKYKDRPTRKTAGVKRERADELVSDNRSSINAKADAPAVSLLYNGEVEALKEAATATTAVATKVDQLAKTEKTQSQAVKRLQTSVDGLTSQVASLGAKLDTLLEQVGALASQIVPLGANMEKLVAPVHVPPMSGEEWDELAGVRSMPHSSSHVFVFFSCIVRISSTPISCTTTCLWCVSTVATSRTGCFNSCSIIHTCNAACFGLSSSRRRSYSFPICKPFWSHVPSSMKLSLFVQTCSLAKKRCAPKNYPACSGQEGWRTPRATACWHRL